MSDVPLRFFGEVLGLSPIRLRLQQAGVALFGEEDVPPSRWGLSSLSQLHPSLSLPLWRGRAPIARRVIISNLYNHTQTPIAEGWSVMKTQVRDFRGRQLTYNSHNGTDFSIPVGSQVCTAAAGRVVAALSQFNRGGLKIFIDHGEGLMTCYAHLARSLVQVGQVVKRGQCIALSGYSGLDGAITFPFGIPHVHFNVWLNGEPTDPFGYEGHSSMWRGGGLPAPATDAEGIYTPSNYDQAAVNYMLSSCKTAAVRERISALPDADERAVHTTIEMNYYPTRFAERRNVYTHSYPRSERLDLPFSKAEFDGVVFIDEL